MNLGCPLMCVAGLFVEMGCGQVGVSARCLASSARCVAWSTSSEVTECPAPRSARRWARHQRQVRQKKLHALSSMSAVISVFVDVNHDETGDRKACHGRDQLDTSALLPCQRSFASPTRRASRGLLSGTRPTPTSVTARRTNTPLRHSRVAGDKPPVRSVAAGRSKNTTAELGQLSERCWRC